MAPPFHYRKFYFLSSITTGYIYLLTFTSKAPKCGILKNEFTAKCHLGEKLVCEQASIHSFNTVNLHESKQERDLTITSIEPSSWKSHVFLPLKFMQHSVLIAGSAYVKGILRANVKPAQAFKIWETSKRLFRAKKRFSWEQRDWRSIIFLLHKSPAMSKAVWCTTCHDHITTTCCRWWVKWYMRAVVTAYCVKRKVARNHANTKQLAALGRLKQSVCLLWTGRTDHLRSLFFICLVDEER